MKLAFIPAGCAYRAHLGIVLTETGQSQSFRYNHPSPSIHFHEPRNGASASPTRAGETPALLYSLRRFMVPMRDLRIVEAFHEPPKDLGRTKMGKDSKTIFVLPKSLGLPFRFMVPMRDLRVVEAFHEPEDGGKESSPSPPGRGRNAPSLLPKSNVRVVQGFKARMVSGNSLLVEGRGNHGSAASGAGPPSPARRGWTKVEHSCGLRIGNPRYSRFGNLRYMK